jgi:hypothetical protein
MRLASCARAKRRRFASGMSEKSSYEDLSEAELRARVLERPDGRLPPPDETKALIDAWIERRAEQEKQVARKS